MDVDMDIDLGDDGFIEPQAAEVPMAFVQEPVLSVIQPNATGGNQPQVDLSRLVPLIEKLHVRGVDNMSTADVRSYVDEHVPADMAMKFEWIDDSSLNIVFDDDIAARSAIEALAVQIPGAPPLHDLENRPAAEWSQRPLNSLIIRYAVESDKKAPRAAERSRYYLMNPKEDPAMRRPRRDTRAEDGEFNRRRYDDREQRRRQDTDGAFGASIYDDDGTSAPTGLRSHSRRRSLSSASSGSAGRHRRRPARESRRGKELFGDSRPESRRGRDRSASPGRDKEGDLEMERADATDRSYRQRDYANRQAAKKIELFPEDKIDSALKARNAKSSNPAAIELFPDAGSASSHGVLGTCATIVEDATDFFADTLLNLRLDDPSDTKQKGRSLADRISAPGSLASRISRPGNLQQRVTGTNSNESKLSAVELFPEKLGSKAGTELFAEGVSIKGRARRRAEDMFADDIEGSDTLWS